MSKKPNNITCFHHFKGAEAEEIARIDSAPLTTFEQTNRFEPDPEKIRRLTYLRKAIAIKLIYPDEIYQRKGDVFTTKTGRRYLVKSYTDVEEVVVDDNHFIITEI